MLSTLPSLIAAVIAAVLTLTPPRLTPTQRARVVIRHAHLAGTGMPVTRADVLDELLAETMPPPSLPVADPEPSPSDQGRITPPTPGQSADDVVSLDAAATLLGVSISTIRRYMAPSSGRLTRSGDGVTRASLEAMAAQR